MSTLESYGISLLVFPAIYFVLRRRRERANGRSVPTHWRPLVLVATMAECAIAGYLISHGT
jgi:hypothetical protein